MTKVYILNPPYIPHFGRGMRWQDTGRGGTLYYPIWLAYATGILEQAGFETKLVDAPAWNWDTKQVIEDVRAFQPNLIVMDSSFPSLDNDISVANEIKKGYPDVQIVVVGPAASQFPDRILQSRGVDIVARWEYDFTVKEIAEVSGRNQSLAGIKGISYNAGKEIIHNPDREFADGEDLDKVPFVSNVYKRHLNIRDYFLGNSLYPEVQIFAGRGCPFQCTFCSWPQTLMGRKYRARNVSNVLDEMEWIQQNLPDVKEVFLEDDTFTIDKKRVVSFTEEYGSRGLDIVWACNARAELDYDTMRKMKETNCRLLIVGYESGSDEILQGIKKGITIERMKQFARDAKRAGLLVLGDFIIGLPGETKETIAKTKRLIKEVSPDILQVSVVSPFPGTELYRWAKENGCLITEDANEYLDERGHQKSIISYPELSNQEIKEAVDNILKHYYLSLSYIPIALRRILKRNGWNELRVLWRSAKAFLRYILGK